MSLPEAFVTRLKTIVPPEQWESVWQALHTPKAVGFRLNPLRMTEQGVSPIFSKLENSGLEISPIEGLKWGFYVPEAQKPAFPQ